MMNRSSKALGPSLALPLCLALLAAIPACEQVSSRSSDDNFRATDMQSKSLRLNIQLPPGFSRDQIRAIAHAAKTKADTPESKVKVSVELEMEADQPPQLQIALWGSVLPEAGALVKALEDEFPDLANAEIAAEYSEEAAPSPSIDAALEEPDDELARQEIVDRLRAQGVEGEIDVKVEREPGGEHRRVEVKVEHEVHKD